MKKTSMALILGLFAVGCEKAPQQISPSAPPPNPAQMAAHMATQPGAAAPAAEGEKKEEEKPAGEAAAPAATEAAPAAEEKKPE